MGGKYEIKIGIYAESRQQADKAEKCVNEIAKNLNLKLLDTIDPVKLGNAVGKLSKNPSAVQMAMKFLK